MSPKVEVPRVDGPVRDYGIRNIFHQNSSEAAKENNDVSFVSAAESVAEYDVPDLL